VGESNDRRSLGTAAIGAASIVAMVWAADVRKRRARAASLHRALVDVLLNVLNAGDAVSERHSRRVADLTDVIAEGFGFSRADHSRLRLAALLHDMGKIDDRFFHIIHSCSPLSEEDRRMINDHPAQSADILAPLENVHPGITRIVRAHHECWDGNGYPAGLEREEIPLESRLISVADVFDAMTQPRSYKAPLSTEDAMRELEKGSGTRFDPRVVAAVQSPRTAERWEAIARAGRRRESAPDGSGVVR
jgi:HD-GYP domain-containing protein (c-di-GMP phosphodiesterase class II)